ncbi:tetratricopeptide repeat protein [Lunatibacter salilacus]|uniref:tetratricopeptide repeat protein n=1 Tax=Lunatibacter salilacus TaxID=2483804 RepID=UPI00131A8FCA|nr:tetratricopeptide repeat protein [Lunatibacter salilacus]
MNQIKNEYLNGNFDEVIKMCSNQIKNFDSGDSLFMPLIQYRVGSYMGLSNFKSAIEDYKKLISIDGNEVSYYNGISYAYWAIGDTINGLASLEEAHRINPQDQLTLSNLSYDFSQAGKYDKSITYATQGLAQNPEDKLKGMLLNNRGFSLFALKKYEEALKDINESIEVFPDNSYAYYNRALISIELKDNENICSDLNMAKQLGGVNMTENLIDRYCK